MYILNINEGFEEKNYNENYRSVRVHKSVLSKLDKIGKFKESYSDVISRLILEKLGIETNVENQSF